jgi:hypothetical protein
MGPEVTIGANASVHIEMVDGGAASAFNFGCKYCRKVLATGRYMIEVYIDGVMYLYGVHPVITCCGKEKAVARVYQTEKDMLEAVGGLAVCISDRGANEMKVPLVSVNAVPPTPGAAVN